LTHEPVGALTGKIAIITGGAGVHGRATAKRFVEAGATVYATDLAVEAGRAAAADCGANFLRTTSPTRTAGTRSSRACARTPP